MASFACRPAIDVASDGPRSAARTAPSQAWAMRKASVSARTHSASSAARRVMRRMRPRAQAIACSTIASATAPNSTAISGPITARACAAVDGTAMQVAGNRSSMNAWLWVARMPWPSHARSSRRPVLPSQGASRTSMNSVGGSSWPGTRAVVVMKLTMPEPEPKCFSPLSSQRGPGMGAVVSGAAAAGTGSATVRVRRMSPPLPGSEVSVPHQWPASTVANTAAHCACHAAASAGASAVASTADQ